MSKIKSFYLNLFTCSDFSCSLQSVVFPSNLLRLLQNYFLAHHVLLSDTVSKILNPSHLYPTHSILLISSQPSHILILFILLIFSQPSHILILSILLIFSQPSHILRLYILLISSQPSHILRLFILLIYSQPSHILRLCILLIFSQLSHIL